MSYKIANGFFRDNAAKLECDFKKTDLYKYLEAIYGPLIYVNEPDGFFISVCKHGKETWVMEKVFYDSPKYYNDKGFRNNKDEISLVEIGCWIPAGLRKYIYRKKPLFPQDHDQGFNLSRGGYCVIDIKDKKLTENLFKTYLPTNTVFDRMDYFRIDRGKSSITTPYRNLNSCLVSMVVGKNRSFSVGTYNWIDKFEKDLVGRELDKRELDVKSVNPAHGNIDLEKNKALVLNVFNPRYYHQTSKSSSEWTQIFGSYQEIVSSLV